jgi:hypothetical protein
MAKPALTESEELARAEKHKIIQAATAKRLIPVAPPEDEVSQAKQRRPSRLCLLCFYYKKCFLMNMENAGADGMAARFGYRYYCELQESSFFFCDPEIRLHLLSSFAPPTRFKLRSSRFFLRFDSR